MTNDSMRGKVGDMETMTCDHNTRSAVRTAPDAPADAWECDECSTVEPMTWAEHDWTRTDLPKCSRCGYSEARGEIAAYAPRLTPNSLVLVHVACYDAA